MVTILCLYIFIHITTRGPKDRQKKGRIEAVTAKTLLSPENLLSWDTHLSAPGSINVTALHQTLALQSSLPHRGGSGQSNLKEESWCHRRTNNPRGDGFLSKGQALVRGQDTVGELPHTGQTHSQTKPSSSHKNSNGIVGRWAENSISGKRRRTSADFIINH